MKKDGQTVDLEALCKGLSVFPGTVYSGNGMETMTGSSGLAGSCQYSWQKDSIGRSYGERAADQRPNGQ
jgi:hypothetical protein